MKQTILAALLLASTTSLFAQKETEKIEFRPHWYMQVQGGSLPNWMTVRLVVNG